MAHYSTMHRCGLGCRHTASGTMADYWGRHNVGTSATDGARRILKGR